MIRIFVPGEPIPKGRPRMTRTGHAYTPQKTRDFELKMSYVAIRTMRECGRDRLSGPLRVLMKVILPVPKSYSKKKAGDCLSQNILPISRPDLDNFIKCLDALNGIVWEDDSQIVCLESWKVYGEKPGIQVEVKEYLSRTAG